MARDRISIQFRGGAKLDKALADIARIKQSGATSIVNKSLSAGATQVKKSIIREVPVWGGSDTKGFALGSRNVTVGQLKRSVTSGLRRKADVPRDVFLAGVWFKEWKYGATKNVDDGFFAKYLKDKTKPNAFGATGNNNFISKGVKQAESKFKNKVGGQLAKKIAAFAQAKINRLG